jgi:spermidine synthase
MGGTAAAVAERRQAHLPLALHLNPHRALFLGPGTGITLSAAMAYPDLRADGVELVPEVVEVMPAFAPENNGPFPNAAVRVTVADARRFVRTTTNRYDVIVGDLFHPAQDGAGFLYTREHFEAVRRRLAPGGLFCQWLPLHQLDETTLRIITRTFTEIFPYASAFLLNFNVDIPVLGLVGSREPLRLTPDWLENRDATPELRQAWKGVNLDRTINLAGCLAADTAALRQFSAGALMNTDDAPAVTFLAPRVEREQQRSPGKFLLSLIEHWQPALTNLIETGTSTNSTVFLANTADWITARNLYLRGLSREAAGELQPAIDLYLESARRSLHFTPAYARCVTIIQAIANADRAGARRLFDRLQEAQPDQPLGNRLLGPLFEAEAK